MTEEHKRKHKWSDVLEGLAYGIAVSTLFGSGYVAGYIMAVKP